MGSALLTRRWAGGPPASLALALLPGWAAQRVRGVGVAHRRLVRDLPLGAHGAAHPAALCGGAAAAAGRAADAHVARDTAGGAAQEPALADAASQAAPLH